MSNGMEHGRRRRVEVFGAARSVIEQLEARSLFSVTIPSAELAPPETLSALAVEAEVAANPQFSHARGFYNNDFELSITTATSGADIRYTLDGSEPSATHGTLYSGAIDITTTTVVRAIAYKDGATDSVIQTSTYLFLADVIKQPSTIAGYPKPVLDTLTLDYQMDPDVVNDPLYKDKIIPALLSIPSILITTPKENMFDNGFYDTSDVEFPISMEYLDPQHPGDNLQENAGIEAHSDNRVKRSLRIKFKKDYGVGKLDSPLFQNGAVGGSSAAGEIDQIVLRAGNNRNWSSTATSVSRATFVEDEFVRQSQIAMSGEGVHGTFVHLYINGIYWGLYDAAERPDEGFGEIYYGGSDDDWFAINHDNETKNGDPARWNYLLNTLSTRDQSNSTNYNEFKQYLDVTNFADYLLNNWYSGVQDWPFNNWWAGGDMGSNMPIKFFTWDAEIQFAQPYNGVAANGAWVHPDFRKSAPSKNLAIVKLWRAAAKSPEFMLLLADRAQKAVTGALADSASLARFDALVADIDQAIIGESARWGDALGRGTITRNDEWLTAVAASRAFLPGNANKLIAALRTEGYFPTANAATFSKNGGTVDAGFQLTVTNPNASGTIYYTLDGTDPRLPGGGLSSKALVYNAANKITLNAAAIVKARVKVGNEWTAITEAGFAVNTMTKLRLTEMMYHPVAPAGSAIDKDEFEFLELQNTGPITLNLQGVTISGGIDFVFSDVTVQPGERVLVVRNVAAFESLYGTGLKIAGAYSGKLDNGGEAIKIVAPGNLTLADFTYSDKWYPTTDGGGYSMIVVDPATNAHGTAEAWLASSVLGGTPGAADNALNTAPNVDAGSNQTVLKDNGASLSGTASDDGLPNGSTLTTEWSLFSGPGQVTFSNAAALTTSASFSVVGTYVLRLTASDGQFTRTSDVTITVNAAPTPVINGSIRGFAFNDSDADGVLDPKETKTPDKKVFLDTNNNGVFDNGEPSMVTIADGSFAFTNLAPGTYYVRRVFPKGYTYSTALININLTSGQNVTNLLIGSKTGTSPTPNPNPNPNPTPTTGTINGVLFWDANRNARNDSGDTAQSGKVVYLDANKNGKLDSGEKQTTTDSKGAYKFANLAAGTYYVKRVLPSGYIVTTPWPTVILAAGQNATAAAIGTINK